MRLLLDTHVVLWLESEHVRIPPPVLDRLMTDQRSSVLVSAVVALEIAIKRSIGKLSAPADVVDELLRDGAEPLPVSLEHAAAVADLPLHHRDPFDRLLVAQAQVEDATIVSAEPAFAGYDVPVLWD